MKIVLFDTEALATRYFNRDYSEILSRIQCPQALILTENHFAIKQREDGKFYYPALQGADYTGISFDFIEQPFIENTNTNYEADIEQSFIETGR
jgi:hypothetical protein